MMSFPLNFARWLRPDKDYMEVPRCETCRYWWKHPWLAEPGGYCARTLGGQSAREYTEVTGKTPPQTKLIEVWDARYDGGAWTAPSFGCVEWEAKERGKDE